MILSQIIARSFELHTLLYCFQRVSRLQFLFTGKRYHNLIEFAHAFTHYGHTMVQCMNCMESYYIVVLFMTSMFP